jgi:hypothetical protein
MKYFFQFEGREKLIVKFIAVLLLIVIGLLTYIAFEDDPIDVHLTPHVLRALCEQGE